MTDIVRRLITITAGSCTCGTKSPAVIMHSDLCAYRILCEAADTINALRATPANPAPDIDTLVDRFLAWPLPQSVCSDLCVTQTDGAFAHLRTGTNLLSAAEARAMIQYLLHIGPSHYVCPLEIQKLFELEQTKPEGRTLAVEWLRTLSLNYGDQIWLPELGWVTKSHPQDGENSP